MILRLPPVSHRHLTPAGGWSPVQAQTSSSRLPRGISIHRATPFAMRICEWFPM
ncbi:hypothetical protein MUK42_11271 [Musa troglodytarum]|uniref:Uncharacterized protein n=1 Tax=Musa troglodytarum TaxID=320322 RepID=A0A9E7GTC6_9LILI|nr:hypothetical protein MUK42_11271 [Musa troglodytarum]